MTYFSKQNQREFFPDLKSSTFILVEVEIWIWGFHLLPIGLLHDSLSDEIGYKTVTFAGYEHSFQAPNRLQEGRRRGHVGKSFTPISGTGLLRLIYRLPACIFLLFFCFVFFTFLNLFSMYCSCHVPVISWNTDTEKFLLKPLKGTYYIYYHLTAVVRLLVIYLFL